MSYPVLKAPYGLIPVNLIGGQVYAGGVRHIPIKSGEVKAIANGDMVGIATDGTIKFIKGSASNKTQVGVFLGCQWSDYDRGFINSNRYPGGVVADDIMAIVVDDPSIVMRVAVTNDKGKTLLPGAGASDPLVPVTVGRDVVGKNIAAFSAISTLAYGRSNLSVVGGTEAVTVTLPLRVVDVVEETSPEAGKFTEVLVKWNVHAYTTALVTPAV